MRPSIGDDFLEASISFRNAGASPGIIIKTSSSLYGPGDGRWTSKERSAFRKRVIVGPGQTETIAYNGAAVDPHGMYRPFMLGILIWYHNVGGAGVSTYEESIWLYYDGVAFSQSNDMGFSLYRPDSDRLDDE